MRRLAMTVTALSMFAAMGATAQADALQGGPNKKGNQCFISSPMSGGDRANGFGYWGACPDTASASVATTPRVTRRNRPATR
jgi:hypothetical protein